MLDLSRVSVIRNAGMLTNMDVIVNKEGRRRRRSNLLSCYYDRQQLHLQYSSGWSLLAVIATE
jgi:hypothetical protein